MSYGVRVVEGAAKNLQEYFKILESQLTTLGLKPRQEINVGGNSFRVTGGFGCKAKIYFNSNSVGNDVIVAPVRSIPGIVLAVILLPLLILPGVIVWLIGRRNVQKQWQK